MQTTAVPRALQKKAQRKHDKMGGPDSRCSRYPLAFLFCPDAAYARALRPVRVAAITLFSLARV